MRFNVTLSAKGAEPQTITVDAKTVDEAKIKASNRFLNDRAELHPFDVKVSRVAPAGRDSDQLAKRVADIAGRKRSSGATPSSRRSDR